MNAAVLGKIGEKQFLNIYNIVTVSIMDAMSRTARPPVVRM